MKKTLVIYTLTFFLPVVLMLSCTEDDCGKGLSNRFRTVDIRLKNLKLVESDPVKGYYSFQSLMDQEVVSEQEYSLELSPEKENYRASSQPSGFSLVEKAYACSPLPPVSDEKITGISITADKDFNADFPAGEDLTALFDVVVVDYYQETSHQRMSLADFLDQAPNTKDYLYFVLNTPPAIANTYQFEIVYRKSLAGEEKVFTKKADAVALDPGP